MNASRELDALVAKEIMGAKIRYIVGRNFPDGYYEGVTAIPHYSTDISAAWLVVEQLTEEEHGFFFTLSNKPSPPDDQEHSFVWCCFIRGRLLAESASAPHAICLAALAALES